MSRRTLLGFIAAGRRLALPLEDLRRAIAVPSLEAPIGAPSFVEGFFDFGGTPVAVLRLDRLLSLGEERLGVYSPLLLLKKTDPTIALHVTRVTSILKTGATDVQPIGRDETFNACVVGRVSDGGETVYVMSTDDILLAEERARIASHRAMKKRRIEALASDGAHAS